MNYGSRQEGSLRLRDRARGPAGWELRYRTTDHDGRRKLKSTIIGTIEEYPTKAAARAQIRTRAPLLNIARTSRGQTVGDLIDRFIAEEHLAQIKVGEQGHSLHYSTAAAYLLVLNKYLRPRWGSLRPEEVRPAAVQAWLNGLAAAPKYKANIRGLLHRLFEKAMFWDVMETQRNPIGLVEVKGMSKRKRLPTVLTEEQFHPVVLRLQDPQRAMVLLAQCTGLRVSEILALQWSDIDFDSNTFQIQRAIVNGRVDQVKTEYSEDVLPLDPYLKEVLLKWLVDTPPSAEGWVFPNPATGRPYHASGIQKHYLRPTGIELGIQLGWHTFRHTYRSWLDATGAPVGVQQKLMRHAQVSTTMNTYGNALMQSKRDANSKVVRMISGEEAHRQEQTQT